MSGCSCDQYITVLSPTPLTVTGHVILIVITVLVLMIIILPPPLNFGFHFIFCSRPRPELHAGQQTFAPTVKLLRETRHGIFLNSPLATSESIRSLFSPHLMFPLRGSIFFKLLGLSVVGVTGVTGYAWYDSTFRHLVEDNVPYTRAIFDDFFSFLPFPALSTPSEITPLKPLPSLSDISLPTIPKYVYWIHDWCKLWASILADHSIPLSQKKSRRNHLLVWFDPNQNR